MSNSDELKGQGRILVQAPLGRRDIDREWGFPGGGQWGHRLEETLREVSTREDERRGRSQQRSSGFVKGKSSGSRRLSRQLQPDAA
jgi:hypothetical protein